MRRSSRLIERTIFEERGQRNVLIAVEQRFHWFIIERFSGASNFLYDRARKENRMSLQSEVLFDV